MEFRHGASVVTDRRGKTPNPYYVTGYYAQERRIIYEPARRQFYRFDPALNRYRVDHEESIMSELSTVLLRLGRNPGMEAITLDRTHGAMRSLIKILKIVAVGSLPGEQDALDQFWSQRVEKAPGSDLTTEELFGAYAKFCADCGLPGYPEGEFQRLMPDQIRERFGVNKRHSILRDQNRRRA